MKLIIQAVNDAVDGKGHRTQGFDVMDEAGSLGWLRPSVQLRLNCGRLDLKPGDTVVAEDCVSGGGWPILVANNIRKVPSQAN